MLNDYLETNIKNKLNLLSIFYANHTISHKDLCAALHLSLPSVTSLVEDFNLDLTGFGKVTKQASVFSFSIYTPANIFELFRLICKTSSVLQCLKFMICNDKKRPFSEFVDQEYLTKSSAYRIRQNCRNYLLRIGLDMKDNRVVGEEYRIRFLIGLLHYKYGIDCYVFDEESLQLIRSFILSTNSTIDGAYLEQTSHEYGYFEYLIFLSWKRKEYPLSSLVSNRLEKFKQLFIYEDLKKALQKTIEPVLDIQFSKFDYDYIYLVYCCTSSCLFADKWTPCSAKMLHSIASSDKIFADLLLRLDRAFGTKVQTSRALRTTMIYFYKKCLLELYCIIPDTNFFIRPEKGKLTSKIAKILTGIFKEWQEANDLVYPINNHHLFYLALQMEFILLQFMEPVKVFILSDFNAELQVMNLYFTKNFSSDIITVIPFLLNTQPKDVLLSQKDSVIIVHKKFESAVSALGLANQNIVIPVTVEINDDTMDSILKAISYFEKKRFLQFINDN